MLNYGTTERLVSYWFVFSRKAMLSVYDTPTLKRKPSLGGNAVYWYYAPATTIAAAAAATTTADRIGQIKQVLLRCDFRT
jgi:hypothetical protein